MSLERLRQPTHHDQMDKIDFRAVVEEACADMGVQILAKGIEFDVTMPDSTITVSGDQVFLTEAIKNLLDNAVKHGGTNLSRISVALRNDAENVKLTVADDGTGLSPCGIALWPDRHAGRIGKSAFQKTALCNHRQTL